MTSLRPGCPAFPLMLFFWELDSDLVRPTPWSRIPCLGALVLLLAGKDLMGGEDGFPLACLLLPSAQFSAGGNTCMRKNTCTIEVNGL